MRKQKIEDTYADKVENIQFEKFEQIKKQAINFANTDSYFLVPGVIRNYEPRNSGLSEEYGEEAKVEEESKVKEPEVPLTKEQRLWSQLGTLLGSDKQTAQALRQDRFEIAEISLQAKKALAAKQSKNSDEEFECKEEGFSLANTQITIIQGKPKKKKRGGRH